MEYEEIDSDKLPRAVWGEMMALIQLDCEALVEKVLSWDVFYCSWAIICRKRTRAERLSYINRGTFMQLAAEYRADGDEAVGTLMTSLWCMPDEFLDDVIQIHIARMAV